MHSLSVRVLQPELLDQGDLSDESVRESLLDLRRINKQFGARRILLHALAREVSRRGLTRFTVLDVASGSCDLPMAIIDWARRKQLGVQVFALDGAHRHLRLFRNEFAAYPELHPFCADALQAPVQDHGFDFVTCSHFLHHLTEERAADLLSGMGRWARHAVIVGDLERRLAPYCFFRIFGRLWATSYVSRIDGRISIGQSFKSEELELVAKRAGLTRYTVKRHWPYQLQLIAEISSASIPSS